jgi:glycosyltransferase involved in cell wall biosynthesis
MIVPVIGTFATQYDFPAMLTVAEQLQARDDVLFLLIGTGSQQEYVEARSRELDNVRLMDWLPHDEMPLAWNASALTMWALRDETLYTGTIPARFYEALACGTPVAAAQAGTCRDLLQESGAGLTVAPGQVDGLRDAVVRLLDDAAQREQAAQQARRYALERFSFEAVAQQYEAIFASIARA